jgi:hypothetical protein
MNEELKKLSLDYKHSSDSWKKLNLLEKIRFAEKTKKDFLDLLDLAKANNLDLEFYKTVIDGFFELPVDRFSLASVYKRLKGYVLENYFIGCLQRKNMDSRTLEMMYSELPKDSDLAPIIFNVIITTAISLDGYLFLLNQDRLDPTLEAKLLTEVKRHNGCLEFWIKILERARPGSALKAYAENILKQKISKRSFASVHELYLDNPSQRMTWLMLDIMSEMASSEKEIDIVLYLAPRDSYYFRVANEKKEKLNELND